MCKYNDIFFDIVKIADLSFFTSNPVLVRAKQVDLLVSCFTGDICVPSGSRDGNSTLVLRQHRPFSFLFSRFGNMAKCYSDEDHLHIV